jgi:uncharacterized membrane protein
MVTLLVAISLLLASVVVFVLLVDKLALLQISRALAYVGDQGRAVIERDYAPLEAAAGEPLAGAELPDASLLVAHRGGPAVVQAMDLRGLVALASRDQAAIEVVAAVGDTVIDGMPLLRVHGGRRSIAEPELRRRLKLGGERTFQQDPKYALRLLVDIAIRALSPAVNDPTTAVQALDQVEDLLLRLSRCRLSAGRVTDASGALRLVFPQPSWEDLLRLAFDEIRFHGASSIQVMRRMRALLSDLMAQVPDERRAALVSYLERVDAGIRSTFPEGEDRKDAFDRDRQGLGISHVQRHA